MQSFQGALLNDQRIVYVCFVRDRVMGEVLYYDGQKPSEWTNIRVPTADVQNADAARMRQSRGN